jgi:hypothetical protein
MACVALVLVFAFDIFQMRRLAHFCRAHMSQCWEVQDRPSSRSEVDDPLLALLCRIRLIRPRSREQGAFASPSEEAQEPQRTELALAEAFNCGMGFRRQIARLLFNRKLGHYVRYDRDTPGQSLERLQSLLCDGVATRMGILFQVIQVVVQLTIAIPTGIIFSSENTTPATHFTLLSINLACQLLAAVFTAAGTANDLWNGLTAASVFALEASSTCCLLWSMALVPEITPNATIAEDNAHRLALARSVQLGVYAAELLRAAIFVPLCLIIYDSIIVPIIKFIWRQDTGSPLELLTSLLIAMVVVPMMLYRHYFPGAANAAVVADLADAADQYSGSVTEVTAGASGSSELCVEEPACPHAEAQPRS